MQYYLDFANGINMIYIDFLQVVYLSLFWKGVYLLHVSKILALPLTDNIYWQSKADYSLIQIIFPALILD